MAEYVDVATGLAVKYLNSRSGNSDASIRSFAAGAQVGDFTSYGSPTLAAAANSTADTDDIHRATTLTIKITGLTTDTVSVAFFLDEAKTILSAAVRPIDLATGALNATSTLANGSYIFNVIDARFVRFTKSAGVTETPVVTYLARG